MIIKARHQGNSTIVTIPKHFKVPRDTEFNVQQDNDGTIIYTPINKKVYDLWSDPKLNSLDYSKLRCDELEDLGYNPRNTLPTSKEKI